MAKDNPLHDAPRSKKMREDREAKRGDIKEIGGEEHESQGTAEESIKAGDTDKPALIDFEKPDAPPGKKGKMEYWRKRKAEAEVPTS